MKRKSDRKCVNYARARASARSISRDQDFRTSGFTAHARLVYMASWRLEIKSMWIRSTKDALERLGKSKFGFESTTVSNFKSKSHEGSGNELVDYSRAPCLDADQKARGLWERD